MTTVTDYQAPRPISPPKVLLVPADLAVAGLWSLLGLGFSAILAVSGLTNIAALAAIAW
jgi:hypothetical protein